jgi:hypothetical protein
VKPKKTAAAKKETKEAKVAEVKKPAKKKDDDWGTQDAALNRVMR